MHGTGIGIQRVIICSRQVDPGAKQRAVRGIGLVDAVYYSREVVPQWRQTTPAEAKHDLLKRYTSHCPNVGSAHMIAHPLAVRSSTARQFDSSTRPTDDFGPATWVASAGGTASMKCSSARDFSTFFRIPSFVHPDRKLYRLRTT